MISSKKTKENKKEKIEEILKENKDNNTINSNKEGINVWKRDDYYKKNLIRIKLFYGLDKK